MAWDHTSHLVASVYNLTVVTVNINSKKKLKPKAPTEFNPYRQKKPSGLILTPQNLSILKAFARGKRVLKQRPEMSL